jgi:hypothetical protein
MSTFHTTRNNNLERNERPTTDKFGWRSSKQNEQLFKEIAKIIHLNQFKTKIALYSFQKIQ